MSNSGHVQRTPDLVRIGEAARRLGVTVETLRRWEREGKITATRTLGGERRFRLDHVEALKAAS